MWKGKGVKDVVIIHVVCWGKVTGVKDEAGPFTEVLVILVEGKGGEG